MSDITGRQGRRKVGLALSGGGFRAALFHLGVLAQLARLGLLREVEVISTVSGGSIIGTFYYLHLRRKLIQTPDADITDDALQIMVNTIEEDFLAGVQKNLRLRTFSSCCFVPIGATRQHSTTTAPSRSQRPQPAGRVRTATARSRSSGLSKHL